MVFYSLLLQFYSKTMGKAKKADDTILRKKTEEKRIITTILVSVDEKGKVFLIKLKLQGELFE